MSVNDIKFQTPQVVRHKKSGKLYAVSGVVRSHDWDAVFYRCHDDGLYMNRYGTRIKVSMVELVPNTTSR